MSYHSREGKLYMAWLDLDTVTCCAPHGPTFQVAPCRRAQKAAAAAAANFTWSHMTGSSLAMTEDGLVPQTETLFDWKSYIYSLVSQ